VIYLAQADGKLIGKFSDGELRAKIAAGEISPDDQYLAEGSTDWKRAAEFPGALFPWKDQPATPAPDRTARKKQEPWPPNWLAPPKSPLEFGVLCAVCAALLPLLHPMFVLVSIALLIASFVLSIIAIVRGKVVGGILLMIGIITLALPASCASTVGREKILQSHP
jgi:GYF domain 2